MVQKRKHKKGVFRTTSRSPNVLHRFPDQRYKQIVRYHLTHHLCKNSGLYCSHCNSFVRVQWACTVHQYNLIYTSPQFTPCATQRQINKTTQLSTPVMLLVNSSVKNAGLQRFLSPNDTTTSCTKWNYLDMQFPDHVAAGHHHEVENIIMGSVLVSHFSLSIPF